MPAAIDKNPLSIIGFFLSEIGLGQAARNIASSFFESNVSINCINIDLPGRSNMSDFSSHCVPWVPGVNNFLVSELGTAVKLPQEIKHLGKGKREFLYPSWELDRLPSEVVEKLHFYDEIFAPSQFISNTFSQYFSKKVCVIPQPVFIPSVVEKNTLADDKLRIFSFFDYGSFASRKNPKAVLEAFQIAFPKRYDDVELLLKVRGFGGDDFRKMILDYALKDPRIKVIDETLDRASMDELIQRCNVFISLHRSEGFGFGPAESLAREKIVISTDYGGTCDFLNHETGYPVGFKLIPVRQNEYPFAQNQLWADPMVDQAALYLRGIYENFEEAQKRAIVGRCLMIKQHSFSSVGKKMKSLLEERGYL